MKGMQMRQAIGVLLLTLQVFLLSSCEEEMDRWSQQTKQHDVQAVNDVGMDQSGEKKGTSKSASEASVIFPSIPERIEHAFRSKVPIYYGIDRINNGTILRWPEMRYLYERIDVGNTIVAPTEVRIIEGRTVLSLYSPEEDSFIETPTGNPASLWEHSLPAVMIPPGSSLVMIRMMAEYERICSEDNITKNFAFSKLWLSYPTLGAHEILILFPPNPFPSGDDFQSVFLYCSENDWAYFIIPGKELDPSKLWLEYRSGTGAEDIVIWTLTERP